MKKGLPVVLRSSILEDWHEYGLNIDDREIFLSSENNNEDTIDYNCSSKFIRNLGILQSISFEPILIHTSIGGGYLTDTFTIYDSIFFSPCYITTLSYGQSISGSSIFIQAADRRILMPNCEMMIHYGYSIADDTAMAHLSHAEFYRKRLDRILTIYANRCLSGPYFVAKKSITIGKVKQFIRDKLKQKVDWYLTADEALYFGFCDAILGNKTTENTKKLLS